MITNLPAEWLEFLSNATFDELREQYRMSSAFVGTSGSAIGECLSIENEMVDRLALAYVNNGHALVSVN